MRERCQCAVTERMCANNGRIYADTGQEMRANSGGICVETTFRECTDSAG